MIRRLDALLRRPATGAIAGQASQAVAGLVLQVAAARSLGAAGLATFSLIYGAMVLVTAVSSGLVGDSLTVLDRHERGVRAGLHVWGLLVAVAAGVIGALLADASGLVAGCVVLLLAAAATAYVLEDALRRLLMATGRFWALPAVDVASLVVSLAALGLCALAGPLTLTSFLLALFAGQAVAGAVAWLCAEPSERPRGPWRRPALAEVWSFGAWRAAGQIVRPTLLTALRLAVVAGVGAAAYGPLEAARVYTAPTLVVVTGLGSYLLPHYVATQDRDPRRAIRAADRAAVGLAAAVALVGLVAVVLQPVVEPLLTGGDCPVPLLAVVGWSAYAVSAALLLPYSGLATVNRRQQRVMLFRLLEFAALALVCVLVFWVPQGARWAPLALAAGPVLAAAAVRRFVLLPLVPRAGTVPEQRLLPQATSG